MDKASYIAHRKKHVKAWQASGMRQADYAASIGLNKETFHDWVKAFGLNRTPTASVIPVRIQSSATVGAMKLTLREQVVLEWSQPPQAAWLVELIKGLT
jgi:hypothetical protein